MNPYLDCFLHFRTCDFLKVVTTLFCKKFLDPRFRRGTSFLSGKLSYHDALCLLSFYFSSSSSFLSFFLPSSSRCFTSIFFLLLLLLLSSLLPPPPPSFSFSSSSCDTVQEMNTYLDHQKK